MLTYKRTIRAKPKQSPQRFSGGQRNTMRAGARRDFQLLIPGYQLKWEAAQELPLVTARPGDAVRQPPMLGAVARIVGEIDGP